LASVPARALVSKLGAWITGDGREADIALTTRARIARNLEGIRFVPRAEPHELDRIAAVVREWSSSPENSRGLSLVTLATATQAFRRRLVSDLVVGPDSLQTAPRALAISRDGRAAILVNEEDHLRIQILCGGLATARAAVEAQEIEESLGRRARFASHAEFGYLTSSVANSGSGVRISAMLHLAGLKVEEKMPAIAESARSLGVAVRGAFGEGSLPLGDLFQVSNAGPTRSDPAEIASRVESVALHLIAEERSARRRLAGAESEALARNTRRALAELGRGVSLRRGQSDLTEAMRLWSAARLGLEMGLETSASRRETNEYLAGILARSASRS
jgi:protein arginine kinase